MQEVELKIVSMFDKIQVKRPFQTVVKLHSNVDRQLGPLTLTMASGKTISLTLLGTSCNNSTKWLLK